MNYKCELCGNSDPRYLGNINGKIYCRKCIEFCGENYLKKDDKEILYHKPQINYELSKEQKDTSKKVVEGFKNNKNILIYAVCGAGKTELVFEVIEYCLKNNLKVGFTIPRKDVVIELAFRLKETFKNNKVISIYGGHNNDLNGDITILTTHQLYRFKKAFDLLIIDEIDAFPFKDNEVLENIFKRSVKRNFLMMSATPSKRIIDQFKNNNDLILTLFKRYHNHPLPIPKAIVLPKFLKLIYLLKKISEYETQMKKVIIFVPTIENSFALYNFLKIFNKKGEVLNSHIKNREVILENFRKEKYLYLVSTAVLERGVTIKNLQVIIFEADNYQYNEAALIQISGRVGRNKDYPDGEIIFLAKRKNEEIKKAIKEINEYNKYL